MLVNHQVRAVRGGARRRGAPPVPLSRGTGDASANARTPVPAAATRERLPVTGFADRMDDAEAMARRASGSPVVRGIARSGYVASGLLRGAIGVLALLLAVHVDGARPGA